MTHRTQKLLIYTNYTNRDRKDDDSLLPLHDFFLPLWCAVVLATVISVVVTRQGVVGRLISENIISGDSDNDLIE